MESRYNVDPEWLSDRPIRVRRARMIAAIASVAFFLVSLLFEKWLILTVILLGTIYWFIELKTGSIEYEDLYVKVLDSGLFQSAPNSRDGNPITLLTPWEYLVIDSVERNDRTIESVKLIDKTLPKGVRTLKIENLERMDELLSEIRNRVSLAAA